MTGSRRVWKASTYEMFTEPPAPHSGYEFLYVVGSSVATFLAVEFRHWYKLRSERKKERARATKDEAEADQIHITSSKDAGLEIVRSASLLAKAELKIGRLELRVERLEDENKEQREENGRLEELNKLSQLQMGQMKCVLDLNGIKYGDVLDEIKGIKGGGSA